MKTDFAGGGGEGRRCEIGEVGIQEMFLDKITPETANRKIKTWDFEHYTPGIMGQGDKYKLKIVPQIAKTQYETYCTFC
jgi:hypothetical protein